MRRLFRDDLNDKNALTSFLVFDSLDRPARCAYTHDNALMTKTSPIIASLQAAIAWCLATAEPCVHAASNTKASITKSTGKKHAVRQTTHSTNGRRQRDTAENTTVTVAAAAAAA